MNIILYTRVSSDRSRIGRSVKEQEKVLRQECAERGWEIVGVIEDVSISASRFTTKERPGFRELQRRIADDEADIVGVYEFSRLTRRGPGSEWEAIAELLRKHDVLLYDGANNRLLDMSNPEDEYSAEQSASQSKLESARISRRVRRNTKSRALEGGVHSSLGFGWRKEFDSDGTGQWVVDSVAALAIRTAVEQVITGTTTLAKIAREWNAAGLRTSRGNEWTNGKVRLALTRPTLAGIRVFKGERLSVPGDWPTILTAEEYAQVLAVLTDPQRLKHRGVAPTHLLTGTARCGVCQRPLSWAGAGRYNPAYRCPTGHVNRSEPDLDAHVIEKLFEAIEEYRTNLFLMTDQDDSNGSNIESTAEHLAEVARLEARLADVAKLYAQGVIPLEEYASMQRLIRPQIETARAKAEQAAPNRMLYDFALDAEALWEKGDLEWRRRFVRAAVEVLVYPIPERVGKNLREFDPEFVSVRFLG